MKKAFIIFLFIISTNTLFADTSQVLGKLETDKKVYLNNEPIEFTYIFISSKKQIYAINTPIFDNKAIFGIGIIIKDNLNQYYKFIRTPFWHYMMTQDLINFSKSNEIIIKYIHDPKNNHCRIINKNRWIDNSPSILLKTQEEFKKGNDAFENASKSFPPGQYTAWYELTLSENKLVELEKGNFEDGNKVAKKAILKKLLVKSKPIEFEILKENK